MRNWLNPSTALPEPLDHLVVQGWEVFHSNKTSVAEVPTTPFETKIKNKNKNKCL